MKHPCFCNPLKYSASGQKLLEKSLEVKYPSDAFVASDGSVYVVSEQTKLDPDVPSELAKYSAAGDLMWQRTLPGGKGTQVAMGGNKVYVSANSAFSGDRTNVITLYRYTQAGARVWRRTIRPFDYAQMNGLSADASGNAYLSGYTTHNDPPGNLFSRKYAPSGKVAWTYSPDLQGTHETALDVSAADSGKVYLVGHTNARVNGKNHGLEDAFLLRLSTAGKKVWSR